MQQHLYSISSRLLQPGSNQFLKVRFPFHKFFFTQRWLPLLFLLSLVNLTVKAQTELAVASSRKSLRSDLVPTEATALRAGSRHSAVSKTQPASAQKTWYRDADGDGFGNPKVTKVSATQPAGYVANNQDCNDYRVFYEDKDHDGWGSAQKVPCGNITRTGDCDDNNKRVHSMQTFYRDADGDSYGDPSQTTKVCSSVPPAGYVANKMDCNDHDRKVRACPPKRKS